MVFGRRDFFHQVEPALLFKPGVYPYPRALIFRIDLAHPVDYPAAGPVKEPLRAFRMGADARSIIKHALTAERTTFEEPSVPLDRGKVEGIERRKDRHFFFSRFGHGRYARAAGKDQ